MAYATPRMGLPRALVPFAAAEAPMLAAVVVLAIALRIVFYTGFFGSDEVTYVEAAMAAAHGTWPGSSYIGAIRLGVNYPIAAFVRVFGPSEPAVAAWAFVCSVLEVGVVYWFACRAFGRRVAVAAGLLLALLPLHVHFAGRIMADAPLALFMTLTFVAFFVAEDSGKRAHYLLAGAMAGCVYWIKEGTTIFVAAFALWALYRRRIDRNWLWSAVAMTLVVGANFAAMWQLSGNPLHLIDSVRASFGGNTADTTAAARLERATAGFYLRFLFVDVWHTWLVGFLAGAGALVAGLRLRRAPARSDAYAYVLAWSVGLLAIFSLFVLSMSPLRLIPKQTNYMTIFLAPLSVLGGIAIGAVASRALRGGVLAVYAGGALLLCALEQQTIHAFNANSAAALEHAARHPGTTIYVVANAERRNAWASLLPESRPPAAPNLRPLREWFADGGRRGTESAVAIVDAQTLGWGQNGIARVADIPACWERDGTLPAAPGRTAGGAISRAAAELATALPNRIARPVVARLAGLAAPPAAQLYRIPETCR